MSVNPDMVTSTATYRASGLARLLSLAATVGPLLLTAAWIVLGLIAPPVRTEYGIQGGIRGTVTSPISGIGVGPHGTLFNAAFVASGLLTIMGVFAVFHGVQDSSRSRMRLASALLLALSPLGFVVAGIFTIAGSIPLHTLGFFLVAGSPLLSFVVAGRYLSRVVGWQRFGRRLVVGSPLTFVLMVIFFFVSFDKDVITAGNGVAGLASRLLAIEIGFWYIALGWLAVTRHSERTTS